MLRIRLDLESLSAVLPQLSQAATEQSQGIREEVMVDLLQHHDGLRTLINQVYDNVDQRLVQVEDMIQKQGDQLQFDQSTQIGPYLRPILAERRRPSSESASRLKPYSPPAPRMFEHDSINTPRVVTRVVAVLVILPRGRPPLESWIVS